MLKTFNKILNDKDALTDAELVSLSDRFPHFAEKQDMVMLEKLWPHIPAEQKADKLTYAIRRLENGFVASPNPAILKHLFAKLEDVADEAEWKDFFNEEYHYELAGDIVASGSIESVDIILDAAIRHVGPEIAGSLVDCWGMNMHHIHMIDHLIEVSHRLGGEELARQLMRSAEVSFGRILEERNNNVSDAAERLGIARYLLKKQFELAGPEAVADSFAHMGEWSSEEDLAANEDNITALFRTLVDLGGTELFKSVLQHKDFEFVQALTLARAHLGIEDLVEELQEHDFRREFIEKTLNHWWHSQSFEDRVQTELDMIKDNTFDLSNTEGALSDLYKGWIISTYPDHAINKVLEKAKSYGFLDLEDYVLDLMVFNNCHEDLKLLAQVHAALGRPNIFDRALTHFNQIAESDHAAETVTLLLDHALRVHGKDHVRALLSGEENQKRKKVSNAAIGQKLAELQRELAGEGPRTADLKRAVDEICRLHASTQHYRDEDVDGAAVLGTLISCSSSATVDAFLRAAEEVGGKTFVSSLLGTKAKPFENLHRATEDNLAYLMGRLNPEEKKQAYLTRYPDWAKVESKRMTKTAFYLAHSQGKYRWQNMTGAPAPDSDISELSPYRFKPKLYEQIKPLIALAYDMEYGRQDKEKAAYQLATLFGSEQEIDTYLIKFQAEWAYKKNQSVHEACDFDLPPTGEWNAKAWGSLVMRDGPDILAYLPHAAFYESKAGGPPASLEELARRSGLPPYRRASEHKELAEISKKFGVVERTFNRLLDTYSWRSKETFLPAIRIDGKDIGCPGYYFEPLPDKDIRGFFLGQIMRDYGEGNCQSVGDNGEDCAIYGMTSRYSGFYVWRKKTNGRATSKDPIVAQSWAWIGQDQAIVFDSFERIDPSLNRLAQPFLEQFAAEIGKDEHCSFVEKKGGEAKIFSGIRLGCDKTGRTPQLDLFKSLNPSQPIDYSGTYSDNTVARDSFAQYVVAPKDHKDSCPKACRPKRQATPEIMPTLAAG